MMMPGGFKQLPDVVKNLLIINGLFFLASILFSSSFGINLVKTLGAYVPGSPNFEPYQLVTHLFMHGSFLHILINMFVLWMFGRIVENILGAQRFFIFYFVAGFGAALLHLGVSYLEVSNLYSELQAAGVTANEIERVAIATSWPEAKRAIIDVAGNQEVTNMLRDVYQTYNTPTVGASGAVYGVLMAFGVLFPNTLIYIYFLFPLKAKYFVIFIGLFEMFNQITGTQGGIAHLAHLGGMIFGFLLLKYWGIRQLN